MTHCALDIICETAMGKSINAQEDSDTDYVRAIYDASDIVFQRQRSPWLWDDRLFAFTPTGYKWRNILATLHGFTNKVIAERKEEYEINKQGVSQDDVGIKKKLAFLDLLIEASEDGKVLSDEDIREEVDTFMFEGLFFKFIQWARTALVHGICIFNHESRLVFNYEPSLLFHIDTLVTYALEQPEKS